MLHSSNSMWMQMFGNKDSVADMLLLVDKINNSKYSSNNNNRCSQGKEITVRHSINSLWNWFVMQMMTTR